MASPEHESIEFRAILHRLVSDGVEFVLIDGVAAIVLGAPIVSLDVDVVPEPSDENLNRLSEALLALHAEVLGAGRVRDFGDGDWLRASRSWNFATDLWRLDILHAPAGVTGYAALAAEATNENVDGVMIMTASIEHLIAMKEAANRPKDQLSLPILRWLRDRDRTTDPEPS